jgi:hypothetical protein
MPGEELAPAYFLGDRPEYATPLTPSRAENRPGDVEYARVLYYTPQINIFPKVKW